MIRVCLCLLIFISPAAFCQPEFKKLFSINSEADMITSDMLGNIYIIKGSDITRYDEEGTICCSYSNKNYGSISSVDTRDPLRILLFYKPFGVIAMLDNKLALQSTIELRNLQIADPSLICSSEIQGIWVYDRSSARLYKFNSQLQPVSLSNDLRQDVMHAINPVSMAESDNWLIMLDEQTLLVFDKLGNYYKPVTLENNNNGQLLHDEWVYCNDDKILRINLRSGKQTEFNLPFKRNEDQVVVMPQRLLHYSGKALDVYSY
jgi:hypothetical protein